MASKLKDRKRYPEDFKTICELCKAAPHEKCRDTRYVKDNTLNPLWPVFTTDKPHKGRV